MRIKELAKRHSDYIVERRRWFHQHPEVSLEEEETTNAIAKELVGMGLPVTRFDKYFGCYADLNTGKPGPTVLLRADIDALTQVEKTGLPFASQNKGKMHACGHDAHIAMLLGAAKILCEMKDELKGTVRFFFQPAEEAAAANPSLIKQGVLDGVDACFGMHVWGLVKTGGFNMELGPRMASCDSFSLTVRGLSAHGSAPQMGHDAIAAAAAIYAGWQCIVSRFSDPLEPLVLTVGTISGGQRWNIISDEAKMTGTVRTFSHELQHSMPQRMKAVAEEIAKVYGCTVELEYSFLTTPVYNKDEGLVRLAQNAAVKMGGSLDSFQKVTGGEDFCYLMDKVPGVFGFLGTYDEKVPGSDASNHNDKYTVDEDALHFGAALSAQFALDFLTGNE